MLVLTEASMVTAFQRQQSSARLFYLLLHLCPQLGHRQAMATAALAGRSRFKLASSAFDQMGLDLVASLRDRLKKQQPRSCLILFRWICFKTKGSPFPLLGSSARADCGLK